MSTFSALSVISTGLIMSHVMIMCSFPLKVQVIVNGLVLGILGYFLARRCLIFLASLVPRKPILISEEWEEEEGEGPFPGGGL